mmetsp:Transcript_71763/g.181055  ORF Transcript_71763/g.181055 Transcript_71763/m.181055 type:complete len:295 (+) Transcript_71763:150-1034(+)
MRSWPCSGCKPAAAGWRPAAFRPATGSLSLWQPVPQPRSRPQRRAANRGASSAVARTASSPPLPTTCSRPWRSRAAAGTTPRGGGPRAEARARTTARRAGAPPKVATASPGTETPTATSSVGPPTATRPSRPAAHAGVARGALRRRPPPRPQRRLPRPRQQRNTQVPLRARGPTRIARSQSAAVGMECSAIRKMTIGRHASKAAPQAPTLGIRTRSHGAARSSASERRARAARTRATSPATALTSGLAKFSTPATRPAPSSATRTAHRRLGAECGPGVKQTRPTDRACWHHEPA